MVAHDRLWAGPLNDIFVLDQVAMAWTNLTDAASGTPPAARYFHGFTFSEGKFYVHGGLDASGSALGDLHSYDPVAMVWTDLIAESAPAPRFGHGFAFMAREGRLYVHDGNGAAGCTHR